MEIEIRLFATLRDLAGNGRIRLQLTDPATVGAMAEQLTVAYPALADALPSALVSVNKEFASLETAVRPGDEIAIFPPVSGGTEHPTYFAVTEDELDINAIHAKIKRPDVGAIISFTGAVRGATAREGMPAQTNHLEYEAYNEMAELKMAQIAREIWEKWPLIKGIAIVQRIGRLDVGQTTTFVACASGHRDQGAFEATLYGIDRLKEIVPVWKKEVGPNKTEWIEGHYRPTELDN